MQDFARRSKKVLGPIFDGGKERMSANKWLFRRAKLGENRTPLSADGDAVQFETNRKVPRRTVSKAQGIFRKSKFVEN